MAFTIDNNGNITMIQGDSGSLVITGLDSKENYKVFTLLHPKAILLPTAFARAKPRQKSSLIHLS